MDCPAHVSTEHRCTTASDVQGPSLEPHTLLLLAHTCPYADIQETSLDVASKTVFRAAAIYGFRNIQGLMRRLRLGKCPYDYVEVMACPSGGAGGLSSAWG